MIIATAAAVVALLSVMVAFIHDPDPSQAAQNIPRPRWQWLAVELPVAALIFAAALTVIIWTTRIIEW